MIPCSFLDVEDLSVERLSLVRGYDAGAALLRKPPAWAFDVVNAWIVPPIWHEGDKRV